MQHPISAPTSLQRYLVALLSWHDRRRAAQMSGRNFYDREPKLVDFQSPRERSKGTP